MERKGLERFAPLTGVLFFVIVIVGIVVMGDDGPDTKDTATKVVEYYEDNDSKVMISSALEALAAVVLVWFAASVRERIVRVEPGTGRLGAIAFAGGVIAAVGLAIDGAIQFATAESAGEITPEATQALNALWSNFFFPMIVGVALLLLAAGLASIRHGALPKALGWIAIVLGVVAITPIGFVSAIGAVLWIGATGLILFLRQDAVGSGAAPPPGPEAPAAPA
jgi:hypothetical protein